MGENGAQKPGGVRAEVSRRDVGETGALFQVFYGELDGRMVAVEGVEVDRIASEICDEAEVSPVGPKLCLATDETGPSHDEAPAPVVALSDLCLSISGVFDLPPGGLFDR